MPDAVADWIERRTSRRRRRLEGNALTDSFSALYKAARWSTGEDLSSDRRRHHPGFERPSPKSPGTHATQGAPVLTHWRLGTILTNQARTVDPH